MRAEVGRRELKQSQALGVFQIREIFGKSEPGAEFLLLQAHQVGGTGPARDRHEARGTLSHGPRIRQRLSNLRTFQAGPNCMELSNSLTLRHRDDPGYTVLPGHFHVPRYSDSLTEKVPQAIPIPSSHFQTLRANRSLASSGDPSVQHWAHRGRISYMKRVLSLLCKFMVLVCDSRFVRHYVGFGAW